MITAWNPEKVDSHLEGSMPGAGSAVFMITRLENNWGQSFTRIMVKKTRILIQKPGNTQLLERVDSHLEESSMG